MSDEIKPATDEQIEGTRGIRVFAQRCDAECGEDDHCDGACIRVRDVLSLIARIDADRAEIERLQAELTRCNNE
jgi:uncharacterized small protein (DUF1192 family)